MHRVPPVRVPTARVPTVRARTVSALPLTLFAITLAITLAGCDSRATSGRDAQARTFEGTPPIRIVCTVGMLSDLVTRIAGDRGKVATLMGPGTDPHLYKASPGDVATLLESDMIFFVGLHLEGRMADAFARLDDRQPTIAVGERIPESDLLHGDENAHDPHLWFDVLLWSRIAGVVRDALIEFDPEGEAGYRVRSEALIQELEALDAEVRGEIEKIPSDKRVLITAHDAFRYFGHAYGIEVIGVQGLSTESEAAVYRINELVDRIVKRNLPAVFVESTISRKNIEALVEGCRARGHTLSVGGELYSDAMGAAGTPAGTYPGMVRHNVATLVNALR